MRAASTSFTPNTGRSGDVPWVFDDPSNASFTFAGVIYGTVDADADAGAGGGSDAGSDSCGVSSPCGVCTGDTPHCSTASNTCVQCLYDVNRVDIGLSYCINNQCF